jgi:type IV secretory pathway TrbL component
MALELCRLGHGAATLCARVWREWERGGEASEEKGGAQTGCSGAPPRRARRMHAAERRMHGVHGGDARVHGRHALP